MKRARNTNYTDSHLKVLFMWAFVPIIFIALAIVSVKWYAGNIESQNSLFPRMRTLSGGKSYPAPLMSNMK